MFPGESVRADKRGFARTRFQEPISYQLKEASEFGGCLGCDISEWGLRINFNDFVPVNTEMALSMKLYSISKVIDLIGRVAWLQRLPYSDRYQVGLQFVKVDPISQEEIRRYVRSQH